MTDAYTRAVNTGLTKALAKRLGLPRPAMLRRHKRGAPLTVGPVLVVADAASAAAADDVAKVLRDWGVPVAEAPEPVHAEDGPAASGPVGDERPGAAGEDPGVAGARPGAAGERPEVAGERPGAADERPGVAGQRPGVADERPGGACGRQQTTGERLGAIVLVLTETARPSDASDAVLSISTPLRRLAPNGRVVTISRALTPGDAPEVAAVRQGVDGFLRSLAKELRAGATGNGIVLADGATVTDPSALAALRFFLSAKSAYVDGQLLPVAPTPADGVAGSGAPTSGGAPSGPAPSGPAPSNAALSGPASSGPASSGPVSSDAAGEVPAPASWDRPLAGKVAVVTGAARGIGAAIATTLARDGAVVVCVDVPAAGEALVRTANAVRGTALQLDVTAPDAGARIVAHATSRHGGLDVVVHNAGITRDKLLANMDAARWGSVVAVNVEAQLRINEALIAAAERGEVRGLRIVSLASTSGIAGNRGQTNYAFTKAGVIGHTAATARALAASGGTANAVAPGFIETEMTRRIPFATRQVARRLSTLLQGGQPVDVAEAIAFLASPGAAGITGQTLRVCGQNLVGR